MLTRAFRYAMLELMRAVLVLLLATLLRADDRTQKLAERLAREAEAFEKTAPQVIGIESLRQRVLTQPPAGWEEREIVSEYGFAALSGGAIHELRQVLAVNRKAVAKPRKQQEGLASLILGNDEQRKLQSLEQLKKYGIRGGATDFGQILLLFTRANQERYEITYEGSRMVSPTQVEIFHYKQLDGPEALTVFAPGRTQHLNVEGEIWVRADDGQPVRITLNANDISSDQTLREEAVVDYAASEFGTLLPLSTSQKEWRAGALVTENQFDYAQFHRFRAPRR